MPPDQVYVLELIINKVSLHGTNVSEVSKLSVDFKFSKTINFEIDFSNFMPLEATEGIDDGKYVHINVGKTFLFIRKPTQLCQDFQDNPFQLTLYEGNTIIGDVSVSWNKDFSDMIKGFESLGIVKSTAVNHVYELVNQGVMTAKLDITLRLSCFGQNVQTMFYIKKNNENKYEYIFRHRNASKTFKVEKYIDERCQPLVAPLYSAVTEATPSSQTKENVSLTQLFEHDYLQRDSTYHPTENEGERILLDFQDDLDKVSMCLRPSENKFFDFLKCISAEVKTKETHTEVKFSKKKMGLVDNFLKSVGDDEDVTLMTAEKITKKLCGSKDCPAAKKFKEYGIGLLATGKSLGTVYENIEPSVTYSISHSYGTMSEYGPYGLFSRPKQEELPFIPRNENASLSSVRLSKNNKEPTSRKKSKEIKKRHSRWHCKMCTERLRGGADEINSTVEEETGESDGTIMPNSPMVECKSVMDQFDSILAKYKKALGPCGHATCPYAQTTIEETCKKMCENPMISAKESSLISCNDSPCDNDGCMYGKASKEKRYPAGCGSPKCAYTKYKLGLLDEDAEMELKFLPPAFQENCGDKNCKYPLAPPLPPIHWECPDPLPKVPCRNLNCPYQPRQLKKFKTKKLLKTGPCGSPMCAYALSQPCGVPTCPFAKKPCPMSKNQVLKKKSIEGENSKCGNPDCPYSTKTTRECEKEDFEGCENVECPFTQKKQGVKIKQRKQKKTSCSTPTQESDGNAVDTCQESSSEGTSICSDPDCPYSELKKPNMKKNKNNKCPKEDNISVCSNIDCPARQTRDEIDNPNICNQPGCPYSKSSSKSEICDELNCPYLEPLPSCGIPNCPYEPIPLRYSCKNPICPSKSVDFKRKMEKNKTEPSYEKKLESNVAENIVLSQTTAICEVTAPCEARDDCQNPNCNMEDGNVKQTGTNKKKKIKRKKKGKFVYSIGDEYPRNKLGHKECVTPIFNVPPNMGWLWNSITPIRCLKPRRGWRPGALTKTIAARIRAHRQTKGFGYLKAPTFKNDGTTNEDIGDIKVIPKPTLQIQKKVGTYWITVNPLKDPFSLVENEDPYMECTPMTFKISKNKKPQNEYCYCEGDASSGNISSSSDSELDIEFTPPAGIINPERFKKRPNIVCCEAQYDPKDCEEPKNTKDKKGGGKGKGEKGGKKKKEGGKKGGKKK